MKKSKLSTLISALVVLFIPVLTYAGYDFNLSVSEEGGGFSFSVSNYYRVPEKEVIIREKGIDDDELPVVFFHSKKGKGGS